MEYCKFPNMVKLKKKYRNMFKTAMSHVAPCPTPPRTPLPASKKLKADFFS